MKEPRHTLYAYVEGNDLQGIASTVEARWRECVEAGNWRYSVPIVVNQRHACTPDMRPDDLPDWDLGVTMALPDPGQEPNDWFVDVEILLVFAGKLYSEVRRNIVVGLWDSKLRISEDVFDVESEAPDLTELREVIGVGHPS